MYSTGLDWVAKSMGVPDISSMPPYKPVPPIDLSSTNSESGSETPEGLTGPERQAFALSEALRRPSIPVGVPQGQDVVTSGRNRHVSLAGPINGAVNPVVVEPARRPKGQSGPPPKIVAGNVRQDTLTTSGMSQNKNLKSAPLHRVNDIPTSQEELSMSVLPGAETFMTQPEILPPRVHKNIISQEHNKVAHGVKAKNVPLKGKVFGKAYIQDAFVPVASTSQDSTTRFLKPAGIAAAGIAGVGTLVGVVWLFDKIKGLIRSKQENGGFERRHGRDWTVN